MVATSLSPVAIQDFFIDGAPAVGGLLFVYAAGTEMPIQTYTDPAGTIPQTSPIVMNSRGEPENSFGASVGIWIPPGVSYKLVFAPMGASSPPTNAIWTVDNLSSGQSGGGSGEGVAFDTVTQFEAASILPSVNAVQVDGYSSIGDGGAGLYKRSMSSGPGAGLIQSADGAWWLLVGPDFTPEQFGAVGDGTADCYAALQSMATRVSALGGGRIRFKAGASYAIKQFKRMGTACPDPNGITDIVYTVGNLDINMNGATIENVATFSRTPDTGQFPFSYNNCVIPFVFQGGSNIELYNGTLQGNNSLITQTGGVGEGSNFGIQIGAGCANVSLEGVISTGWATDGLYIGAPYPLGSLTSNVIPKDLKFTNCQFTLNQRNNVSVGGARRATFTNCWLSYAGFASINPTTLVGVAGGSGAYAPGNGVDIEPEMPGPDQLTGEIRFSGCTLEENSGKAADSAKLQVGMNPYVFSTFGIEDVHFTDCKFHMRATIGVVQWFAGTLFWHGNKHLNVAPLPNLGEAGTDATLVSGEVFGNTFTRTLANMRLLSGGDDGPTGSPYYDIHDNLFFSTPATADTASSPAVFISGWPNTKFRNNYVYFNDNAFFDSGSAIAGFGQLGCQITNNTWIAETYTGSVLGTVMYEISTSQTYGSLMNDRYHGKFQYGNTDTGLLSGLQDRYAQGLATLSGSGVVNGGAVTADVTVIGARQGMNFDASVATALIGWSIGVPQWHSNETVTLTVENLTGSTANLSEVFTVRGRY